MVLDNINSALDFSAPEIFQHENYAWFNDNILKRFAAKFPDQVYVNLKDYGKVTISLSCFECTVDLKSKGVVFDLCGDDLDKYEHGSLDLTIGTSIDKLLYLAGKKC